MAEKQCEMPPIYRFTWPGKDEGFICAAHMRKLTSIATHMGVFLRVYLLTPDEIIDHKCCQMMTIKVAKHEDDKAI